MWWNFAPCRVSSFVLVVDSVVVLRSGLVAVADGGRGRLKSDDDWENPD
jgi:hypothetical protein